MNRQRKKANGIPPHGHNAFIQGLSVPGFNFEAVAEMQKRNWEAILDANRVAAEGYQTLLSRQMEIVQTTLQQASDAVQRTLQNGDTRSVPKDRVEVAKAGLEQAIGNLRELVEIAQEANTAPIRIIQDRFSESIEEWRKLASR